MTDPLTTPRDEVVKTAMAFRASLGGPTQNAALVDLTNACATLSAAEVKAECDAAIAKDRQRILDAFAKIGGDVIKMAVACAIVEGKEP